MQLAIYYSFKPERREPVYPGSSQTQLWALIGAFKRGERLTVLTALQTYQIFAISQRVGELKNLGWPIQSKSIKLPTGKTVSEYFIASTTAANRD